MSDGSSCIDELEACFVACEEAYVRLRAGGVAARDSSLGNALLLAAATSVLTAESLSGLLDAQSGVLVAITTDACRACALECERDGAHWLTPAHDACTAAAAACLSLTEGRVANGE